MKLLYVWIEEFRNIHQQGFPVDNEYIISFNKPAEKNFKYFDFDGNSIIGTNQSSSFYQKVYYRDFVFTKNPNYLKSSDTPLIRSITALVGENASGKTSIMECIYRRADQCDFGNSDQRYYCLVFLDEDKHCLIVRTKDVWLSNSEFTKKDFRQNRGYEEYIIPLSPVPISNMFSDKTTSIIVSVYQDYRENTAWSYQSLGVPTYPINLNRRTTRNAFLSIFDFICSFPSLGSEDNSIIFYLQDNNKNDKMRYFSKMETTPEEYKYYFILKLAQLLFERLRDYLYHPQPEFSMDGQVINQIDENIEAEDYSFAQKLSFLNRQYPIRDGISLVGEQLGDIPENKIAETIESFRHSTFIHLGKSIYDDYLNRIEKLFTVLYKTDSKYFTGFYRLSLPFKAELRNLIESMSQCLNADSLNENWTEDIVIDLEWFSAGEYQRALLFSGLYETFNSKIDNTKSSNLILLFDEPEMHMHPEAGRKFIPILTDAMREFQRRGFINQCQLILATHSPFIIQQLAEYNGSIELVSKNDGFITWQNFDNLSQLSITTPNHYSFNLVMYYIFGVPTIELHIELYGYIQKKANKNKISLCDKYIADHTLYDPAVHSRPDKYGKTQYETLPTYIRNAIDHPNSDREFKEEELRTSIELLIAICKQLNE